MALDFFAGCLGGCAGVLVGHPLDTVKVRLQIQDPKKPLYRGTFHCVTSIIKNESFLGLYKGISSPMAGLAFINAIVFGIYGNAQRAFSQTNSLTSHFMAGVTAGSVQSVITSPMELTKTRLQLQGQEGTCARRKALYTYRNPLDCLTKITKVEGYRGIFRGFWCTLFRDAPAFGTYFYTYEFLCQRLLADHNNNVGPLSLLMAGGMAGITSWVIVYPVDVIKSRIQADGMDGIKKYSGIIDCAVKSYRNEGMGVFTRGLNSTIIRAFPTNAATFAVVTWVFKVLGDEPEQHGHHDTSLDINRISACAVDSCI